MDVKKEMVATKPRLGSRIQGPWIRDATIELIKLRQEARVRKESDEERRLHEEIRKAVKADKLAYIEQILEKGSELEGVDQEKEKKPGFTWVYGINDHLDEPEDLGPFQPEGVFRKDFENFCDVLGAVHHATLGPQQSNKKLDPAQETTLCVRSTLIDRFSIKVLQLLLPTSHHLETLIFSGCRLDVDMVGLLRKGLGTEGCTIHNLQLEWNPLEVPFDPVELAVDSNLPSARNPDPDAAEEGDPGPDEGGANVEEVDLDQLELKRDRKQGRRTLAMIQDFIWQKFGSIERSKDAMGSMDLAWEAIESSGRGAEKLHPGPFAEACDEILGLQAAEAVEAFEVLDGIHFGMAEGRVTLNSLKSALQDLPEPDGSDADKDALGAVFASLVDAGCLLESLSLRGCGISRRELVPIVRTISAEARHLTILNLWGNRICDHGVEHIVSAMQEYRGLEYLGLGQNRITDVGLWCLVKGLGPEFVSADDEAEIRAQVEAKAAEVNGKQALPPRVDANGYELHERPVLCDELVEQEDPSTGGTVWIRKKPSELKILNLSENPINDVEAIQALQPQGDGVELILKQTPAARILLEAKKRQEKERRQSKKSPQEGADGWKLVF